LISKTETSLAEQQGIVSEKSRAVRWEENRPASRWSSLDLRETWAYRELAMSFALRNLQVRYKQTFFGIGWAILQPLIAVLIFTIFLGRLAGLPSDGIPYAVFAYAGMTVWLYFSSGVTAAAQSLVDNRDLVSKVYFPRVLAPASAVAPGLVDMTISLGVLAVLMAAYRVAPGAAIVLLPAWALAAFALTLAIGLWLSALNVKYRDVKHALGFLTQVWLFASPVAYSASLVEGNWKFLYAANPIVGVLEGFRWSLIGAQAPGLEAFVSLGVGLLLLVSGAVYFGRVQAHFADLV
jgi:lipopolysaccharide transport system permease protein